MILSRWPIVSSRTFNLPKTHYDDKFNMQMPEDRVFSPLATKLSKCCLIESKVIITPFCDYYFLSQPH
jgi:hypothetical protein